MQALRLEKVLERAWFYQDCKGCKVSCAHDSSSVGHWTGIWNQSVDVISRRDLDPLPVTRALR